MDEKDQAYRDFKENKKKLESLEAKIDKREMDIFNNAQNSAATLSAISVENSKKDN